MYQGKQAGDLNFRVSCFREVLHAGNDALGYITAIQDVLCGERHASAADVRKLCAGVIVQSFRMVTNLNRMREGGYQGIIPKFDRIAGEIKDGIEITPSLKPAGFVLPFSSVDRSYSDFVGKRGAFIGEATRILGGQIPSGFVTTFDAYRALMEYEDLGARITAIIGAVDVLDVAACFEASAQIVRMIEGARVPSELRKAIETSLASFPAGARLAVWAGAIQEGGRDLSLVVQERSMFNISASEVFDVFRKAIAGKYTPHAIHYRLAAGYDDAEIGICCCVMEMVQSEVGGIAYSCLPTPSGTRTVVQAVRGLSFSATDGSTEPDTYWFDAGSRDLIETRQGVQTSILRPSATEGTVRVDVGQDTRGSQVLRSDQAVRIAESVWRLESALGAPIEMEWALDQDEHVHILQVSAQMDIVGRPAEAPRGKIASAPVIIEMGSRASGGCASGNVHHVWTDLDLLKCPKGSVIVAHEANPRFAVLLPQAAAIVADRGEATGHLAITAREVGIPALFATRNASELLTEGATVTVDADAEVVYAGRIEEALAARGVPDSNGPRNRNRDLLASVSDWIVPLTLGEKPVGGYSAYDCHSIHDIIRFCHQSAIDAAFDLGDQTRRRKDQPPFHLVSDAPIECWVFDLGGGLRPDTTPGEITIQDVACRPMIALWRGLTDPRINRRQGSIEPSYAFLSSEYLNLSTRMGGRFSTVDVNICHTVESNHASFRFEGGPSDIAQRRRRAQLIARLLKAGKFESDYQADAVQACVRYQPPEEMEKALQYAGLLMGYLGGLNIAFISDGIIQECEQAFLSGDLGFQGRVGEPG